MNPEEECTDELSTGLNFAYLFSDVRGIIINPLRVGPGHYIGRYQSKFSNKILMYTYRVYYCEHGYRKVERRNIIIIFNIGIIYTKAEFIRNK